MSVIDASALLAFLLGEPGADVVESHLDQDALCSAVNWSEVFQKLRVHGKDPQPGLGLLASYGLRVVAFDQDLAETTAKLWQAQPSLSLGDRSCLALGLAEGAQVVTADRAWGSDSPIVQIR